MLARPTFLVTILVAGLVVACGSSSSTTSDTTPGAATGGTTSPSSEAASAASCTPGDAPSCGPARHLPDVEAFLTVQTSLAWQAVASSRTGTLFASPDLVADADLEIEASTISLPAQCASSTGDATARNVCAGVAFREDAYPNLDETARVSGVSCAVTRQPVRRLWGALCAKLTIARGTVFRIRNVLLDNHPELPLGTVEIVAPCTSPCRSGEARCAATQVCLRLGHDTCAYCEGKSVLECACRGPCSARGDGTACYFDSSPDQPKSGTCSAGTCAVR